MNSKMYYVWVIIIITQKYKIILSKDLWNLSFYSSTELIYYNIIYHLFYGVYKW